MRAVRRGSGRGGGGDEFNILNPSACIHQRKGSCGGGGDRSREGNLPSASYSPLHLFEAEAVVEAEVVEEVEAEVAAETEVDLSSAGIFSGNTRKSE